MQTYQLTVNGESHTTTSEPDKPLLWILRDQLKLKGTKYGCGIAQCGACTVHVDGQAVKSCTMLAVQADGCTVTTIEGLGANGLHPVQQAFSQCHGLQCGFCTPGMVMASVDLLRRNPKPTPEDIAEGLSGNLCRCTGYVNIIRAVQQASQVMQGDKP